MKIKNMAIMLTILISNMAMSHEIVENRNHETKEIEIRTADGEDYLSWNELHTVKKDYHNIFKDLDESQIDDLKVYLKTNDPDEKQEIKNRLEEQNLSVEFLLLERDLLVEKKKNESMATNPILLDKEWGITGYAVPIEIEDGISKKFFILNEKGMCSHSATPFPNQVILVNYNEGIDLKNLNKKIWIEGTMKENYFSQEIMISDGFKKIESAYELKPKSLGFLK